MITKLFCEIEKLESKYISQWEDVCNIESPTAFKEGVDRVGEYYAEWGRSLGFDVEVFPQPVSGNVVIVTMNSGAAGRPIALSGHIDTVHPVGSFGNPAVKIDGDRIYGPGVSDCKGGIVVGALIMEALKNCGFSARPVMLMLQSDEENSSRASGKATIRHICERAVAAEAFFNLEAHNHGGMVVQRKGILNYTFKVQGVEAHSSKCAKEGASAILEAAHKIIEMEKLKDHEGLTCNCGLVKGGSVPNTVPGKCEFNANIRFATQEQLEYAKEYARRVAETVHVAGCTCEIEEISFRLPMERSAKNIDLAERMNSIWSSLGMPTLSLNKSNGGSDAADVTSFGIPCIDSLGVVGGGIHSPDEYALIPSLVDSAKRLAPIIWSI